MYLYYGLLKFNYLVINVNLFFHKTPQKDRTTNILFFNECTRFSESIAEQTNVKVCGIEWFEWIELKITRFLWIEPR